MTDILEKWNGEMSEESYAASVYEYTLWNFHNSLFHNQIQEAENRFALIDVPSQGYVIQHIVK